MNNNIEFGKRLNKIREERDIAMSVLAEAIGTTKSNISRYENGKTEPGLNTLSSLAAYFGVTMDWLAGNGDINDAQHSNKNNYDNAVNKCIQSSISPEKLSELIDVLNK